MDDTNDDSPVLPAARTVARKRARAVSQEEADRFNRAMEARGLPHRARIDANGAPHFVIEPPLPPGLAGANYKVIYADRDKRRGAFVRERERATDPQTIRRLDVMIDTHDRGTDRIRSHDPKQQK